MTCSHSSSAALTIEMPYDRIEGDNLNKYITGNLIFNCTYTTLFVIFVCGNEKISMPWWGAIIIAIVPSVLICFITLYVNRKSQIKKNTEEIQTLNRRLGLDDKEALSSKLESQYQSILRGIGKTDDDKTLTGQHRDMRTLLQREIRTAERRYTKEEARIRNFSIEQHNMAKTIQEFHLFMESWKRLAADNNDLLDRISKLEQENEELKKQFYRDRHRDSLEL